jgi:Putative zinc-finger
LKRKAAFHHNTIREGMNHQLAVNTKATERYLLGELDDDSRSAFEEHYFSCRACADDVRTAAQFVDNAKAVMSAGRIPGSRWFPGAWAESRVLIPAALAACLAVGYFLPHPELSPSGFGAGGVVTSVTVPAGTRSAGRTGQLIVLDKETSYFMVRLDVADDVRAPRLLWRVRAANGQELSFRTGHENQTVLPLRASDFPSGQYELILSPDTPDSKVIDRYPFAIQHR